MLHVCHGFDAHEKAGVDAFLGTISGLSAMQTRVDQYDNRLLWSS